MAIKERVTSFGEPQTNLKREHLSSPQFKANLCWQEPVTMASDAQHLGKLTATSTNPRVALSQELGFFPEKYSIYLNLISKVSNF